MVPHHEDRNRRGRRAGVEPVELLGRQVTSSRPRNGGVDEGDGHTWQPDPLVPCILALAAIGVVVAAHDVEAVAERRAVAVLERGELGVLAVRREVALDDDGREVDAGHLGDGRPVHHLRVGRRARRNPADRSHRVVVDAAGLDLPEVNVVDGCEAAAQGARRSAEGTEADAVACVLGLRLETLDAVDGGVVVEGSDVVADGGQLDGHGNLRPRAWPGAAGSAGSTTAR